MRSVLHIIPSKSNVLFFVKFRVHTLTENLHLTTDLTRILVRLHLNVVAVIYTSQMCLIAHLHAHKNYIYEIFLSFIIKVLH